MTPPAAGTRSRETLRSDLLLLVASFIWGTTFVAQRLGMDHVGPMTYNALRFALGALAVAAVRRWTAGGARHLPVTVLGPGALAGVLLFAASSLQQIGLQYTTVAKAGFITSLYVVFVPLIGLGLGQRCGRAVWLGVVLATTGMYLMTLTGPLRLVHGDLLELIGALFWAGHVLWVGFVARRLPALPLAVVQFAVCAGLGAVAALAVETPQPAAVFRAWGPLLYGGILSAGVAFTLQIVSQRHAPPAHAAVIMSLETVFAALAGWVVLGQGLSGREALGAGLILSALLVVQMPRPGAGCAVEPGTEAAS